MLPLALRRAGAWVWPLIGILGAAGSLAGHHWLAAGLVLASIVAARAAWLRERHLRHLAERTEALSRSTSNDILPVDRLANAVEALAALTIQRNDQRHSISGLPTREPLFATIEATIAAGAGGALGLVSLADFEQLAAFDTALADRILVTQAGRMNRMLGGRHLIAQVDRSLIAIWYEGEVAADNARAQLNALGYALSGPIQDDEREILPEVRTSVAVAPHDGDNPRALLARATAALSIGGPQQRETDVDPVAVARERYTIEQDLRRAIDRGEFELHFQPLIDSEAGRISGAEALLRWHHPVMGAVSPARFIPIAEAAGLADEIGAWVLNAACREAAHWQRAGLGRLRVAVNVSGHQLKRDGLNALVERTLERHSLAADALEVELTETVAAFDPGRAAALFRQLRALGVAIAIDDFGTGYSSLSALRTLTFDKLKIDREFVTAVDQRRDSQAICRSILALGQGLGIRVLAEGVERREEFDWLRSHGCSHFQGFHFSKPLEHAAFEAFVRDRAHLRALLGTPPHSLSQPERLRA